MSRPLAVVVAEYLLYCEAHPGEWGHVEVPRGAGAALARLVEAGEECSLTSIGRDGNSWDAALRDVAAALGVTE